jgi:transcriptional regulator GlxA family with amidase domain
VLAAMHDFTIVVLDDSLSTGVAATLDVLATAVTLASRCKKAPPRWRVCSPEGGDVRLSNGLTLPTQRLPLRARPDRSRWIIAGLGASTIEAVQRRMQQPDFIVAARAIARHVAGGGRIAAGCTAVFLLQAAGVLGGRRVTTTWWLAAYLQQLAPQCVVDADLMLCNDGPLLTAGAAFAQTDLMLHVLREHSGPRLSDGLSRLLLIDGRTAQAPFIAPEMLANGDALVNRVIRRVEAAMPARLSIERLAGDLCMSSRTLSRHVHRATGRSTIALIHSVRLRKARELFKTGGMSVEQVAAAVGYQDATALRRMLKKQQDKEIRSTRVRR